MHVKPFQLMVCRTPAFPVEHTLSEVWDELKEMIRNSSPSFYALIANKSRAQLPELNDKVKFTLWKYFNRAKYRATPFGTFATFSTLPLAKQAAPALRLRSAMTLHQFVGWNEKENNATADILTGTTTLFNNTTLYRVGHELRYITFNNNGFQLSAVAAFNELDAVIELCQQKTSVETVCRHLQHRFNMNLNSCKALLQQMVALQLLLTSQQPNITGTDYFERVANIQITHPVPYIIAERDAVGAFNAEQLRQVPQMIYALQHIKDETVAASLHAFKAAFAKRFEDRHIPLAIAMDPTIGIGYSNLEQLANGDELIDLLNRTTADERHKRTFSYTALHAFLLNRIMAQKSIDLKDFEALNTKELKQPLPNTLSVIFHLYKGNAVMESIGGCTANALLGRFTLASRELEQHAREIAALEQQANDGVLFFDIAYQAEKEIDNVNRRKHIYAYELPILTWSTTAEPLDLNDIMIGITDNELILSSKKHGKRLIPRISTAYNYTRSDLGVYRLLCDLQHEGINSYLQFNLSDYFSGLEHYPRVCFGSIVVAPAKWLLPNRFYQHTKEICLTQQLEQLQVWLRAKGISAPFKAGHGDQTLTFFPEREEDLIAFLTFSKQLQTTELYISEALLADGDLLKDEYNRGYHAQYLVNYYHKERIYQPVVTKSNWTSGFAQPRQALLPGSDWLYVEFYCHELNSNLLLLDSIGHFLKQQRSWLKKWFFIRYRDPAPHIRLRLNVKSTAAIGLLLQKLKDLTLPLLLSGVVKDYQIKTYYPETLRYGTARMDLVEKFFHLDSQLVLSILKKTNTTQQLYAHALQTMQFFCNCYTEQLTVQLSFVQQMAGIFANEMQLGAATFKKINMGFAQFRQQANPRPLPPEKNRKKILQKLFNSCTNKQEREKLLADLIHMHLNRCFATAQRKHEAILYQYLLKLLLTKQARQEQP